MARTLSDKTLNEPVTQHMRRDFTRLGGDQTVGDALTSLREAQPEGRVIYFYVTDDDGKLQGVVPTRRLLLSQLDTPIKDIMVKPVISIPHSATVLDACEFFTFHRLLAFPIVDDENKVIGLVDVDLYTEELSDLDRHEGNEDLFQLIGVHLTAAQQANPWIAFRQRFPWLMCNIGGGIMAAFLSGLYEWELQQLVALALFIPVVLALAESVGIQSVSLTIQLLRGVQPTWSAMIPRLGSETATGALLGIACGILVGTVAIIWLGDTRVLICLLGGISGSVAAAAVLGLSIPYVLHLLQRDPQVAAGPVVLAMADMVTLLVYFNLARWMLG